MALRVIGAGFGRTGTHSLKLALEHLLGAPCYHMAETFGKPDHVVEWQRAVDGEAPDWDLLFDGYAAAVDWPAAAYYDALMERYPDALVLLSTRPDAESWWQSANSTIFPAIQGVMDAPPDLERMIIKLFERELGPNWRDRDESVAAYLRHNDEVRAGVPSERLIEWQAGDGWGPICSALGVAEPSEPFPHVNTTAEFRQMTGLD